MKIFCLHDLNVDIHRARDIQVEFSKKIIIEGGPDRIKLVAGADLSYSKSGSRAWSAVVVFDIERWEVVEETIESGEVVFPYIPGYFSFREIPLLLKTFEKIKITPEVILLDGHGIAHPRRIGLASHVGLFLDSPTVGCAKNSLIGDFTLPDKTKGSYSALKIGKEKVGWVLRTSDNVKPIFVSPGHKIDFESSLHIVMKCCRGYRVPEPLRRAHILANRAREKYCSSIPKSIN